MTDEKSRKSDEKSLREGRAAREGENPLDMDPADRTAEAVAQREAGDPRPVSQIEGENLAADDQVVEAEKAAAAHVEEAERLRKENAEGRHPDRRDSGERDPELSRGKNDPSAGNTGAMGKAGEGKADGKAAGEAHTQAHP